MRIYHRFLFQQIMASANVNSDAITKEKRRNELNKKIRDNGLARIASSGSKGELIDFYNNHAKDYNEVSFIQGAHEWLVPSNMNYFHHECYC